MGIATFETLISPSSIKIEHVNQKSLFGRVEKNNMRAA